MKFLSSCRRRNFILKLLAFCLYQHLFENSFYSQKTYVQLITVLMIVTECLPPLHNFLYSRWADAVRWISLIVLLLKREYLVACIIVWTWDQQNGAICKDPGLYSGGAWFIYFPEYKLPDFKLAPCSECFILSFGWFPAAWHLCADVSEHSVQSSYRVFRNIGT